MLPAQNRLRSRKKFNDLFRKGKIFSDDVLIMKAVKSSEAGPTKIGFAVGLGFSKKASKRNIIKRWLREAARSQIKGIKPDNEIIFIAKSGQNIERISKDKLQKNIKNLLKKADLLIN